MSLLDDCCIDYYGSEYNFLDLELTNIINSIEKIDSNYYQSQILNANLNDNSYANLNALYYQYVVESAFLSWILIVNYTYIYQFLQRARQLRLQLY